MQIPYEIKPTPHRGGPGSQGIFATARIPKGALIWDIQKAAVEITSCEDFLKVCQEKDAKGEFHRDHPIFQYCYFSFAGELIDISRDDGRFFNHGGKDANTCEGHDITPAANGEGEGDGQGPCLQLQQEGTYASRDIEAGEELLTDYAQYGEEPEWYMQLLHKHGVPTDYY